MKPSRIVLLLVAIIAGGLAAFLATRGGNQPAPVAAVEPQVIEEARTRILVATAPIGLGQRLSPETVQWADWPEGAVRPGYITVSAMPDALEQLSGAVARFEMFPGDPVLEAKLVRSDQGYLSAVLAKGKRGVSIAVAAESASGGFIVPNDHVDVVLTRSGDAGRISETILSNVRVLAINARLGETGATGGTGEEDATAPTLFTDQAIATLELTPEQGERVINASKVGTLSLALRSIADFDVEGVAQRRRADSRSVRMIKFGQASSVMAGDATVPAAGQPPATVDPVSYEVPVAAPPSVPLAGQSLRLEGASPPVPERQ